MNIALFGGTFDPVHKGHVAVAHAAMADPRFKLERIYFIPADWPPHKQPAAITPYVHRYAMLELALRDEMFFTVSEIEACTPGKPEPNYSIQTVRRFRETLAYDDELYFIIGADSFRDLHSWREPKALLKETRMIVVNRPGNPTKEALEGLPEGARLDHISFLEDIAIDISSSSIRATLKRGDPADSVLDPLVAEYIRKHRLYV